MEMQRQGKTKALGHKPVLVAVSVSVTNTDGLAKDHGCTNPRHLVARATNL